MDTSTGEIFTDEQVKKMMPEERKRRNLVQLSEQEAESLNTMNRQQRRKWLRKNRGKIIR